MRQSLRKKSLSQATTTNFIRKIIKSGFGVHELARKIHTQPNLIETALSGNYVGLTHKTQFALVKLYIGNFSGGIKDD